MDGSDWRPGHLKEPINDERVLVKFKSEPVGATVLLDGQLLCKETP
jgi:hypothetical protein